MLAFGLAGFLVEEMAEVGFRGVTERFDLAAAGIAADFQRGFILRGGGRRLNAIVGQLMCDW